MPRFPHQGVVHTSTALWRCAWAAVFVAAVADARTLTRFLRHKVAEAEQAPASPARERVADPCTAWLQEHAGHKDTKHAGHQVPPCPCMNTPPPLMTPEQRQMQAVEAGAQVAYADGLMRIQQAAKEVSEPMQAEFGGKDIGKEVGTMAGELMNIVETNQTNNLKLALTAEETRQEQAMVEMEKGAHITAELTSQHMRQTAEQWAENQARNYIYHAAGGPLAETIAVADKTAAIRQEATELTKGAIKSAANSLEVAKKAQAAIDMVPKDAFVRAKADAKESIAHQEKLNVEIKAVEGSVRKLAELADEGYRIAQLDVIKAKKAETTAREAYHQAQENANKIEKLKNRAQGIVAKAQKAKKNMESALV